MAVFGLTACGELTGVPETMRNGFLDEQFWEVEDWDGFLRSGQEETGGHETEPLAPDQQP